MKKFIVFLVMMALTVSVFGSTTAFDIQWGEQSTYHRGPDNKLQQWAEGIEGRISGATGNIVYVDSGVASEGDGSSWENAFDTLQEGIDATTSSNGDVVNVREGTTGSIIVSGTITCNKIGVTYVGHGKGDQRPTFTASAAATAKLLITADDNYFYNFIFQSGKADLATVLLVTADDTTFNSCSFRDSTSGLGMVTVGAADGDSDRFTLVNCDFYQPGTTNDHSVEILFDMNNIKIANNIFYGDYDEGVIYIPAGGNACLDLSIIGNIVSNVQASGLGIEINGTSTTGILRGNTVYVDTFVNGINPGALKDMGGNLTVIAGDEAGISSLLLPAIGTVTAGSADDILKKLYYTSDGAGAYPETVANDSALAKIMASGATATASTFDNTTDSLQAISDKITALQGLFYTGTATAGSTTEVTCDITDFGDEFFKTDWVMVITQDGGLAQAAPEGEIRDIEDYVSTTGVFTVAAFTSGVANTDKVMVVRRETLTTDGVSLNAVPATGSLATFISGGASSSTLGTPCGTDKSLVDALGSNGVALVDDAVAIAGIIGIPTDADNAVDSTNIASNADGSVFERLEFIQAFPGVDSATNFIGIDDAANLGVTTSVTADEDGSVLERLEFIQDQPATDVATNYLGVDDAANLGLTTAVVPDHDGSVLERLEAIGQAGMPSYDNPNYFMVAADMTSATWNTADAHEIATVTGICRVRILAVCTATVVTVGTNGTIALGYEDNPLAIFTAQALDACVTDDILTAVYGSAGTSVQSGANSSTTLTGGLFDVVVVQGKDIGYTIATNAGTTGNINFHIWWTPLDATGAVVAGAGIAL